MGWCSRNVIRRGSEAAPTAPISLRAGPLSLRFEPDPAMVRSLRLGGREVLRGIYAAVRDRDWRTVEPRISNLTVHDEHDRFRIEFEAACSEGPVDFLWRGTVVGERDGSLIFTFDGEARSDFLRNRIGFCVLHPIDECSGRGCVVETIDGRRVPGVFPTRIAPHQPFRSMAAIEHEVARGIRAEVRFSGDVFEMEDQRNWTDDSYKTYCTPLDLPYPAFVRRGDRVRQSVRLTLSIGAEPPIAGVSGEPARLSRSPGPLRPCPSVGLARSSLGLPLAPEDVRRLRMLSPAHLRADVRFRDPEWEERLRAACGEARAIGTKPQPALFLTERGEEELGLASAVLEEEGVEASMWLVYREGELVTPESWARAAREVLQRRGRGGRIAVGTDANFAEVNRSRPRCDSDVCLCYSITPQVHGFDDATILENIAAQLPTLESAAGFHAGGIAISAITLRPRFNPVATSAEAAPDPSVPPPEVDPRQASLLCASWTLGSLAALCPHERCRGLTYFETTGGRGVLEAGQGVFPVFHVLADVCGSSRVGRMDSSRPREVAGLRVLHADGLEAIVIGNLTAEERPARVEVGSECVRIRCLDETTGEEACLEPEEFRRRERPWVASPGGAVEVRLRPYATCTLEVEERRSADA